MKPTAAPPNVALQPVETDTSALVHPTADRALAAEHWLLTAHPAPEQARQEWQDHKIALLPLGTLFSAVRVPAQLLHALAGTEANDGIDEFLDDTLDGGPVICDPRGHRYYALTPAPMPHNWHHAAHHWQTKLNVELLGPGTYLGVPHPNQTNPEPCTRASYWSVPIPTPTTLCTPLNIAHLLTAAHHTLVPSAAPAERTAGTTPANATATACTSSP